jgi:hypothetical protein
VTRPESTDPDDRPADPDDRPTRIGPDAHDARPTGPGPWSRRFDPATRLALPVLVAAIGALVAVALFGSVKASIGPFDTTLTVHPVSAGGTDLDLAPLGTISVDSHDGPLGLTMRLDQLREADARAIADDPERFALDEGSLTTEVREGVIALAGRVVLSAVLGGAALSLLWRRRWQSALAGGLVGLVLVGGAMGVAARTWEPDSLAEPRYSGLLSLAPQAVGDARDVVDRFADYQAQMAGIVENVAVLYQGASTLRSFQPDASTVRVLHVTDLHLNPQGFDLIDRIVPQFGIEVVVDTGDINDWGTTFEADFADRIDDLGVPYLFVRGNHDSVLTAEAVAAQPNAVVLDDEAVEVAGLTFWGAKDPRFTPDKTRPGSGSDQREVVRADATRVRRALQAYGTGSVDVVLVHDPLQADELGDRGLLVLAGHRHVAEEITLGTTTVLVEGSTGGAGLRSLQSDERVPLSTSVLYIDADSGMLQAYDRIEVAGVDQSEVRIERRVLGDDLDDDGAGPTDEDGETDEDDDDG